MSKTPFIKITRVKIKDCCEILDNKRIPVNEAERNARIGDIPYYGANGLQGYIDDYLFDETLILVAEDGGYFEKYDTKPIAYLIEGRSWVNNHAHVLRAKPGYNQTFIFYCLEHQDVTPFIKGGTRAKLNQWELQQVTIPSFALDEQNRIAEVLTIVDLLIKKTRALISKYYAIKRGLIQDLFTRGIDPTGRLRPSPVQNVHLYKTSEIGLIPVDWTTQSLEKIARIHRGRFNGRPRNDPKYYGGSYPFIQTADITNAVGQYLSSYKQTLNEQGARVSKLFPKGTILVTIAASIADTAILDIPMYLTDSIVGVIPRQMDFSARFIELAIRRNKRTLDSIAPQSAQKNINLESLKPLLIPTPKASEQHLIASIYETIKSLINHEKAYLNKLALLKSGLRQDLLSGKLHSNRDFTMELTEKAKLENVCKP